MLASEQQKKTLKRSKIRYTEYYDLQPVLDGLYADGLKWKKSCFDGTPGALKGACPVWSGGKSGDCIKGLPITIRCEWGVSIGKRATNIKKQTSQQMVLFKDGCLQKGSVFYSLHGCIPNFV